MTGRPHHEPTIVGFFCNWCSYAAADRAGQSRLPCPANLRVIRVPCSGRVEPELILQAFAAGADGVLVCGCHPGDCHYLTGNARAAGRMHLLRRLMEQTGVDPDRLWLRWAGASEAQQLVAIVESMTDRLRALGPHVPARPSVEGALR